MEQIDYINQIIRHPVFKDVMKRIKKLEQDRIYCCHQLPHLLDVARMAWIMYMEDQEKLGLKADTQMKQDIYVCALLHDLGRADQYEKHLPHEQVSYQLAGQILTEIEYPLERKEVILKTIISHNQTEREGISYIHQADHMSRNCFDCQAIDSCKWSDERKNMSIHI